MPYTYVSKNKSIINKNRDKDTWHCGNILLTSLTISSICLTPPPKRKRKWKPLTHCLADRSKFITDTIHTFWTKTVCTCRQAAQTPRHSPTYSSVILHIHTHTQAYTQYTQVNTMPDILVEYLIWLKNLWREGCHCSVILFLHQLFVFWQCMNKDVTLWTDSQCVVSSSGAELRTNESDTLFSDADEVSSSHESSLWSPGFWKCFNPFPGGGIQCWHFIMFCRVTVDTD